MRRLFIGIALGLLAPATLIVGTETSVAAATMYSAPLSTAIGDLPVAAEDRTGYKRSKFKLWIDADGNGCNTRYEVLIAEAVQQPSVGSGCTLSKGQWFSYYDGASWTDPADLDIDHVVALAETWDSGASQWTAAQRQAYANDLGDPRTLIAVTDRVNQSKGDQDPTTWLPDNEQCRYLDDWVAVKIRWRLSIDTAEQAALQSLANGCADDTITVEVAI
jgi:Protein of unknown function (DUF1524)